MYKKILIPTDGSPCAQQAVQHGLELASRFDAEVIFLHAIENPLPLYAAPEAANYSGRLYQDLKEAASVTLAECKALALEKGVASKSVLVENRDPVQAIHDHEQDADLVVMGTHGRRGVGRWLFGSVAEGALRRAGRPFLLVRSKD